MRSANISVVIPTCYRVDKLVTSLQRILACEPPPSELIVHVDAGDAETARCVRSAFASVQLIESVEPVGPGGGRNRLIAAASCPFVASFDDDSYPIDSDYFACLERTFDRFPEAGVVAVQIFHEDEVVQPRATAAAWVADFVGCGCAYRRDAFKATSGYVPLRIAYGMEEVDLSLRLQECGWRVLKTEALRVFHATRRQNQACSPVIRASIANLALLAFLRYPARYWWIGIGQVLNRIVWLIRKRRWSGILDGIAGIPMHLWRYRRFRALVTASTLLSYLALRRRAIPLASGIIDIVECSFDSVPL